MPSGIVRGHARVIVLVTLHARVEGKTDDRVILQTVLSELARRFGITHAAVQMGRVDRADDAKPFQGGAV